MRAGWAIVLAAGGSRRMGSPKALLPWGEAPLVAAHLAALAPFADRLAVVVGSDADRVEAALPPGVLSIRNPSWDRTRPSDSARLAAVALGVTGPCLVTPVDVPPAAASLLRRLLDCPPPARPVDPQGTPGHPAWLGPAEIARLVSGAALPEGLRSLLVGAREVPAAAGEVGEDFDDPEAWRRALAERERSPAIPDPREPPQR